MAQATWGRGLPLALQPSSAAVPSTQSRRAGQPASPMLGSSAGREGEGWGLPWHHHIPGMTTGSPAWIWDPRHSCGISAMENRICTVTRSPKQPQHPRHGYGIPGTVTGSLVWLWDSWWSYSIYGTARTPAMGKSICAITRSPKRATASPALPWDPWHSHRFPGCGQIPKTTTASPAWPQHPWCCYGIPGTSTASLAQSTASSAWLRPQNTHSTSLAPPGSRHDHGTAGTAAAPPGSPYSHSTLT